jgi:hypothetical protein
MSTETLPALAAELVAQLREIRDRLAGSGGPHALLLRSLSERLEPHLALLDRAVSIDRNRPAAERALAGIKPVMRDVCAAATRGEIEAIQDLPFDRWTDLETIFQETRFRGCEL